MQQHSSTLWRLPRVAVLFIITLVSGFPCAPRGAALGFPFCAGRTATPLIARQLPPIKVSPVFSLTSLLRRPLEQTILDEPAVAAAALAQCPPASAYTAAKLIWPNAVRRGNFIKQAVVERYRNGKQIPIPAGQFEKMTVSIVSHFTLIQVLQVRHLAICYKYKRTSVIFHPSPVLL